MADLSVAHRAALAQIIEGVPDRTLTMLAVAVSALPGQKARTLETMLAEATLDRTRRTRAFAAIAPLFRPRLDGVAATLFPAAVFPRLWKLASAADRDLLPILDDDDEREARRVSELCGRLCLRAASAVRDTPDLVWPKTLGPADERDAGLAELARCCDLGSLTERALPSLSAWVGRPDGDQSAELRLLVRDASAIAPDGGQRLLEMLFAHLGEAALILRLVVHSSNAALREAFLSESELAVFVDRLLAAVDERAVRIAGYRPGDSIDRLKRDLSWAADVLNELDLTVQLERDGVWGKRARDARGKVSAVVSRLLGGVDKAVDRALPVIKVQMGGRMSRSVPHLDLPLEDGVLCAARSALVLVPAVRSVAAAFGCEGRRQQLLQGLVERLTAYADQGLEAINCGEPMDEPKALERIEMIAAFLETIEAANEARTVRRRAAVAGGPPVALRTSPAAA